MSQQSIFLPMLALGFLTFFVLGVIPVRRFAAVRQSQVVADDFRFGESAKVPGHVSIPNRNYMNLLELPVLFYVVGFMSEIAGTVDPPTLVLAWSYVGLRFVHSLIHLTYNRVTHRLVAFAASNVVLIALWVWFVFRWWPGRS